jgi:hypothetical protein
MGEDVLGVLDVQHKIVNGLTQADADLLQSIANQVAIALQNAQIYALKQQQAEQQALISTISQKIQSTNSIEDTLMVAVRELGRAVNAPKTRIQIFAKPAMQDNVLNIENQQE